ncbi:MAG: response regulator transcription factor [Chitinophagales bacterium]
MMPRILLVEDEENLQEAIKMNLEIEGYEVVAVGDGLSAIKTFHGQRFNMIVLDIMLPEVDGIHVCEKVRLEDADVPILFLTAKDAPQDKVIGLKKGADDYMTKPFNLEEFLLRVKRLIRQSMKTETPTREIIEYSFGNNEINFATYKAVCQKGEVSLTNKESKLLKLLIERNNEVVSREQILQFVWGYDVYPSTRTIDNFILAFRKYFEEDPKKPEFFHSIRGVGYKFTNLDEVDNTQQMLA